MATAVWYALKGWKVLGWGKAKGARRVSMLTGAERRHVRLGGELRLKGCPLYRGSTERRVVFCNGRYYTRMIEN